MSRPRVCVASDYEGLFRQYAWQVILRQKNNNKKQPAFLSATGVPDLTTKSRWFEQMENKCLRDAGYFDYGFSTWRIEIYIRRHIALLWQSTSMICYFGTIYVVFFAAMHYFVVLFETVKIGRLSVLDTLEKCKNNPISHAKI